MTIFLALLVAVFGLAASASAQAPRSSSDDERFHARAEYLSWWTKDGPERVPLVTDGRLSTPGTRVFMGGEDIDVGRRDGARLTLGYWLTPDRRWGLEASGFYLP